ncbi:MAG: monovalent cation/H(+) antiporter subunit G [Methanosarcinales archaeon]|nr:MAG: monovalent cation/H(+) antiporter subunit G [Methanosarcinales archaeon]
MSVLLILSTIFLLAGSFFFIVGSIGLNRLPDVYTRLHATTKCDTLGQALVLLGVIFYDGATFTSVKILLIIVFVLVANPTAAHALAKGAYLHGVKPCDVTSLDMYKEEAKRIKRRLK